MTRNNDADGDKGARPIVTENHEPGEKTHRKDRKHEEGADPIVEENDESGRPAGSD